MDAPAALTSRLDGVARSWRFATGGRGFARGLVFLALGVLALALLDTGLHLPLLSRRTGLILVTAVALLVAMRRGLLASWRPLPREEVALWVESRRPGLGDAWISALQLPVEEDPAFASPALVRFALARIEREAATVDLRGIVAWSACGRMVALCAASFGTLALLGTLWGSFGIAIERLWNDRPWPQRIRLDIVCQGEGLVEVETSWRYVLPEGEALRIRAERREGSDTPEGGQVEYVFEAPGDAGAPEKAAMTQQMDGTLVWTFDRLDRPVRFKVLSGDFSMDRWIEVGVLPRPQVRDLRLTCTYPVYTGRAPVAIEPGHGDLEDLVGTRVAIEATTNHPVVEAAVVLEDGTRIALAVGEGGTVLTLPPEEVFEIRADGAYQIEVRDARGLRNLRPIRYAIRALSDRRPEVRFVRPGRDLRVVANAVLPLEILFTDDLGLAEGSIAWQVGVDEAGTTSWAQFSFEAPPAAPPLLEQTIAREWALTDLSLTAGQVLRVRALATDFLPTPEGPNQGVSQEFLITIVTEQEIAQLINQMLEDVRAEVTRARDDQGLARQATTRLMDGETDDAWRARAMGLLGEQHDLAERTRRIADRVDEVQELIRINHQEAAERDERLRKVEDLLRREIPPRMELAGAALATAGEAAERRAASLREAMGGQEDAIAKLDEVLSILSEVANFNEVVLRTRRLIEMWEEILRSTEGLIPR